MAETDKLLNLTIEQGATFRATINVYQPGTQTPQDLTGCTGRAQIRAKYNVVTSPVVLGFTTADNTIEINGSLGTIDLFASANATLAIPVKAPITNATSATYVPPSQLYYFDLDLTYPSGDVVRVCYGIVTVYATTTAEPVAADSPQEQSSSSGPEDTEDVLTTANYSVAAGTAPEAIVASSSGVAQHLFSITVLPTAQPHNAVALTDGPGGALLAVIPANFPGGDVPLSAPRFFGASVYANTDTQSPAFSIGIGP